MNVDDNLITAPGYVANGHYHLVRVSAEMVDRLVKDPSKPVVVVGMEDLGDGTYTMTFQTPNVDRLHQLIADAHQLVAEMYDEDEDNDSPGNMAFAHLSAALMICEASR